MIVGMILLDLFTVSAKPHEVKFKEAASWSVFYITIAVAFGIWVWVTYSATFGTEYFAAYLIEKSLSVENIFVIFGAILIYTGVGLFRHWNEDPDPQENFIIKRVRKWTPMTDEYHGTKLFVRIKGKRLATPMFIGVKLILTYVHDIYDPVPNLIKSGKDPSVRSKAGRITAPKKHHRLRHLALTDTRNGASVQLDPVRASRYIS